MAKWIDFVEIDSGGRKTKTWHVRSKEGGNALGVVRWYSPWRKYCFFPAPSIIVEPDCLRDIASFLEEQTGAHRDGLRAAKALAQP